MPRTQLAPRLAAASGGAWGKLPRGRRCCWRQRHRGLVLRGCPHLLRPRIPWKEPGRPGKPPLHLSPGPPSRFRSFQGLSTRGGRGCGEHLPGAPRSPAKVAGLGALSRTATAPPRQRVSAGPAALQAAARASGPGPDAPPAASPVGRTRLASPSFRGRGRGWRRPRPTDSGAVFSGTRGRP